MNELIQRRSEAIPSEAIPWLTNVAAAMQRVQTERLWYVLIATIIVSFGWVLGREVVRRLSRACRQAYGSRKHGTPSKVGLGNH